MSGFKLTEERINANYAIWLKKLEGVIPKECIDKLVNQYGDAIKEASYGMTSSSGTAFKGALIYVTMYNTCVKAIKINCELNNQLPIDSIVKVCLLQHISKAVMYEEETNDFKIKNGSYYKFAPTNLFTKTGSKSLKMCVDCGITFTDEEWEAMTCLDVQEEDVYRLSMLSTVIRSANQVVNKMFSIKNNN